MRRETTPANPGPRWGYRTIAFWERILPRFIARPALNIGVFIGLLRMPRRRRFAAAYWKAVTGRQPTLREQHRHFRAFMEALILKLQAGRGTFPHFRFANDTEARGFIGICQSGEQALLGTFHVGYSDMMGCMLRDLDRSITMVRLQVANSHDLKVIESAFAGRVRFLWVNDPSAFLFQLKEAIQGGETIGLQCDRIEVGSKTDRFRFLGAWREFPVTIYHLAGLFNLPVVFAYTGPILEDGFIEVHTSPVFYPAPDRRETLERGKAHFQEVLEGLEAHLQKYPHLWFNFLPLNREVAGDPHDD